MPRKAFLADLKDAKSTNIPNIAAVEAGTNSGTFSFSYLSHHLPESSVIIQGEVPEVSDYPTNHDCFLFINPDQNPPASIPAALGRISSEVKGKTLLETLTKVATSLNNELDPTAAIEISDSDEGYEGGDFEFDEEEEDDEAFSGEPCEAAKATYDSRATPKKTSGEAIAAKKIRSDLRAAQRAGFRVGVLGDLTGAGIVCTSIRVTKLGISEEAMKAWGLRRKQYLILMIRFMDGYQTVDQVQNESSLSGGTQIRAALCERYKPTFDDATNLFTHVAFKDASVQNQRQKAAQTDKEASIPEVSLEPLFIGGPINDLFRERFAGILKYRRACGYSWSGAETFYNDIQGKNMSSSQAFQPQYQVGEDLKGRTLPDIVVADAIGDPIGGTDLSLPLIAMQFLLRHFVRCTEFCLVCHCKVDATFEALKPYVCPKPLCLYQYMALGFGPSISWEIITQPYVVDVLVSFCYVSARNARLKDFPTGIGMKVPMLPQLAIATAISDPYAYGKLRPADPVQPTVELKYEKSFSAQLDRANSELLIEGCKTCPVRGGDWVVVQSPSLDGLIHYRIVDHALFPTVKLDGEGVFTPNHKPQTQISSNSALNAQPTDQKHGFIGVNVFIYDKSFDDLPVPQQQRYVTLLLDTLPPILKLREYLLASHQGPEPQLRTRRHDLSDSALNLLRWIIASNRSCIMQVDKLHEKHADPIPLKMFSVMGGSEDRVSGMDEYLQFRFAQGAPDKEQRFINQVSEVSRKTKNPYPTIFAWHGSPLANWHSIVREGLHYQETMHGRAYGHGVYMSPHAHTSLGYSGMNAYPGTGSGASYYWPNSDLKISSAISLNEVVNCPKEFVSQTPHYVVAQLDWIQTRYLFVKTSTTCHTKTPPPAVSYAQDPTREAMGATGGNGAVVIPITAVSKSRRPVLDTKTMQSGSKKAKAVGMTNQQSAEDKEDDDDSILSDQADREYLDSDMEDAFDPAPIPLNEISNGRSKRPRDPVGSASSKVADLSLTDFVPGSLDMSSFKMLKEPAYATPMATKRLGKLLADLVKVQNSTPLHELGWYIDENKVENLYQWVIELHSFDRSLPLWSDMKKADLTSIVLEMRFTENFPYSPPFVRVVRPRFLPFMAGGGGHVTAGGAICMELLTNNGWLVTNTIESVLLQIRMAISSTEPKPARLENAGAGRRFGWRGDSYAVSEAIEAYKRACMMHGWSVPADFDKLQREH